MSLTQTQKNNLTNNLSEVESQFNQLTGNKQFMCVCFSDLNRLIVYSNSVNSFTSPILIGRRTITLACVYDTDQDFNSQTNTFFTN